MNGGLSDTDPRLHQLRDALERMSSGDVAVRVAPSGTGDALDDILVALDRLVQRTQASNARLSQRLDHLVETTVGIASLDFSRRPVITGDRDDLDALAAGLQMLCEELHGSTVSRAYMDNIIESMPDGLLVVGVDGTIRRANRAFSALLGRPPGDLLGAHLGFVLGLRDLDLDRDVERLRELEVARGGARVALSLSTSRLRAAHGEPDGFICVVRDVTERKRGDEERARLLGEVEAQAAAIRRLSTPLIPISDEIVVMPLIGVIDSLRAEQVMQTLLEGIQARGARTVILDVTGVHAVDDQVADALLRAASAARLLGAEVVLTGMRGSVAATLVGLGVELDGIKTLGSLQSGIAFSMRRQSAVSTAAAAGVRRGADVGSSPAATGKGGTRER